MPALSFWPVWIQLCLYWTEVWFFTWQIFGSSFWHSSPSMVHHHWFAAWCLSSLLEFSLHISKMKMNYLRTNLQVFHSLWQDLAQEVDLPDPSQQPNWIWANSSYTWESEYFPPVSLEMFLKCSTEANSCCSSLLRVLGVPAPFSALALTIMQSRREAAQPRC